MKKLSIIITVILALLAAWFFLARPDNSPTAQLKHYASAEYGISFSYPATYTLVELNAPGSQLRKHHAITLISAENLPAPENGEGSTAITVDIYQNDLDNQTTEEWVKESNNSNFKLSEGTLSEVTIAGLPALSYRWSGLYEGTTIAIAKPKWIYAFAVTYLEMGDQTVQDFVTLRDSITLTD